MAKDQIDFKPIVRAIEDQTREIKKLREEIGKLVVAHHKALAFLSEENSST